MSDKKIYYDGYVGIGTDSPDEPLAIAGSSSAYLTLKSNNGEQFLLLGTDGSGGIVSSMKNHDLQLRTGNDTKVIIKSNGNMGVGTTNPQNKMHVVGGATFQGGRNYFTDEENRGRLRVGAAWGIPGIYSEDGQDTIVGVGGGNKVFLGCDPNFVIIQGSNGHVGIGTREPAQKLEVVGSIAVGHRWDGAATTTAANIGKPDANGGWGAGSAFIQFIDVKGNSGEVNAGTNICFFPHAWGGAQQESMIIAGNGNVGIGTHTPAEKLQVDNGFIKTRVYPGDDNTPALGGFVLEARKAGGGVHTWKMYTAPVGGGHGVPPNSFSVWDYPDGQYNQRFTILPGNNPTTVTIDAAGNMGIGNSAPQYKLDVAGEIRGNNVSPSDVRYKENILPIQNALDKVSHLQGVTYNLKDKAGKQIGLIAQDVESVVPEIVSTDGEGYKSLAYDKLTALLIESVKELKAENEQLRQRLNKLESRMASAN